MLFGVTLPQFTKDPETFASAASRAETLGLDSVWVFDHLWPLSGGKDRSILEGWTSLSWLAAATKDIGIGTLVTRSSLRHPAVLTKMIASVAQTAGGRLTVTIGSGDELSRGENEAFGIPYHGGEGRIDQLTSTVKVVTELLQHREVTLEDDYVSLRSLPLSPRPSPNPAIWVAGRSDDALEIAGSLAKGWNGWGSSSERFAQDALRVTEFADAAGHREVELTWAGLVVIGEDDAAARAKLGDRSPPDSVIGGPDTVARHLEAVIEAGARHVILTFTDASKPGSYELLAEKVKPLLGI
ncbi:MAG: LLM class flavin-dependent oxidoreductase [Actinomycetota bacterium]|nr:LLM class flavin-dependent oxidoreductase [Actinomycetota bacterium]